MYITYNRKLHERTQRHKLLEEDASQKYDPIRVDAMNFNSEWLTGIEGAADEFVYSEQDGLTWVQVEEASGAADHPGPSTRSGQCRAFTYRRSNTILRGIGTETQMQIDQLDEVLRENDNLPLQNDNFEDVN